MAYNDNVVFKTSTTATIDDLFNWDKSTGQITAKTDSIPIVPGTVYFTADGHIVHDLAQNNRVWMGKNAYSAIYAKDISETHTDIANAIKYSIHYVEGPTTDTTPGTWTGTINGITELYDGLTIIYVPAVAGKSPTTTLNINGLGAKICYYTNTSIITTHYSVGTPILLTYRNDCWRRADYNSNTTYSAMSVAEMRTGTATSSRTIRADYLKTFLSTLGGTNLTLTHSASEPYLQLNHDPSGITAGTYGNNSQQTPSYGGTFNIPYFTVDAQGHITNASTTTVKLPASDNTDYKVRQTPINSNDNNNYRILLSNSANDTSEDSISKKNANLIYNPTENKLSTGNIKLTGELDVTGNVYLRNQTAVDNLTTGGLIVNGNSTFNNDINLAQGAVKWTNNSLPAVTSADYFLVIDGFANGGATKYITKANAVKSLISSSAIGSSTKPVYWTGSAFSAITSYSGAAALTGTPTAPTAAAGTSTTQIATTEFVTNAVAQGFVANDAMVFKGLIGSNQLITQLPTSGYNAGWTYRVANAGIFAGEYCEVGDLLIAINDGPTSGSSVINADWGKVEHNIDGAVFRGSGASNSSVGSSTQPVYVNGSGVVTAINYTIDKSVPSGAVFTDTLVKQTAKTDNIEYKILTTTSASPTSGNAAEAAYDTGVTINPSIHRLSAAQMQAPTGLYSYTTSVTNLSGYIKFATLTVTAVYFNRGIQISYASRNNTGGIIYCIFSNINNKDPDLTITKTGPAEIYYKKSDTSTWDLYISKTESYDQEIFSIINPGQLGVISNPSDAITWKSEHVAELPEGYLTAAVHTIKLNIIGNANTATIATTARGITSAGGTTANFWRGDNSWSNVLEQTAATTLGIDTSNLRIGPGRKTLHIATSDTGSGAEITDGQSAGITFGISTAAYAGIYYQSSNAYGSRLYFATTNNFSSGSYVRMMIAPNGRVGIGTTSPSSKLHVVGDVTITNLTASQAITVNENKKLISTDLTTADSATSGPAVGTDITYIAKVTQNAIGKISVTKSTMRDATDSQSGIVTIGAQTFAGNKTFKGHIYPQTDITYDLGSSSLSWKNLFLSGTTRRTIRIYPFVTSQERSQWYKITFPYSTATTSNDQKWFMNSFDLHFGGGYNFNATGVAHVTFYWSKANANNNGVWSVGQVSAMMNGILMDRIKLYYRIDEPGVLYVNNISNEYNGIWLDNLYVDDTARWSDWSTTKIETCSAITANTNPALSDYTQVPTTRIYDNNSTITIDNTTQINGNLTLHSNSGDSQSLIFNRLGNSTDWKIVVTAGKLSFQSGLDGSTWTERAYFKDNSGDLVVNSLTAKNLQINGGSAIFAQTAATTLGIDTSNSKIGTAIRTLHIATNTAGSGDGVTDGQAAGITFGTTVAYAGIYYQSSNNYGSRLYFATTNSFANGAYARMMITHDGKIGIGTTSPSTLLHVAGDVTITGLNASQAVVTDANKKLVSADLYWANIKATLVASYNKTPEVANIKLNGNTSATAASTKNVQLIYDTSLEVLNFVFS